MFYLTQLQWKEPTDISLSPTQINGLKVESLVRTRKIATLDRSLAKGLLGKLTQIQISELNSKLKILMQIP